MTMLTKTPASVSALVTEILNFAATSTGGGGLGGTIQTSGTNGGYTNNAVLMPSGVYFTFAHNSTEIRVYTSTAWDPNAALTAQTGACSLNGLYRTTSTPVKAWLFGDGKSIHVVVNPTPAAYHHFSFGTLEKCGTYTGGEYVAAGYYPNEGFADGTWIMPHANKPSTTTAYANHVRVTYSGRTNALLGGPITAGSSVAICLFAATPNYSTFINSGELLNRQPNSYNARSMIFPHQYFLGYDVTSNTSPAGWIPLGKITNSGYINIENIAPEQVINTDWIAFPLCMKYPVSPVFANREVNTKMIGLAYKQ